MKMIEKLVYVFKSTWHHHLHLWELVVIGAAMLLGHSTFNISDCLFVSHFAGKSFFNGRW